MCAVFVWSFLGRNEDETTTSQHVKVWWFEPKSARRRLDYNYRFSSNPPACEISQWFMPTDAEGRSSLMWAQPHAFRSNLVGRRIGAIDGANAPRKAFRWRTDGRTGRTSSRETHSHFIANRNGNQTKNFASMTSVCFPKIKSVNTCAPNAAQNSSN